LEAESGQGLGQGTVGSTRVNSSQRIDKKIVIIIVLKPDSMVNPGEDPGHESEGLTQVDPNLQKKKSIKFYPCFISGQPGHWSTRVFE
jgi:hypothetical protein